MTQHAAHRLAPSPLRPPYAFRCRQPHAFRPHLLGLLLSAALAGHAVSAGAADAPAADADLMKGRLLVQPRAGLPDAALDRLFKPHGGRQVGRIAAIGVHVIELPSQAAAAAVANLLRHHPHLQFAEVDRAHAPALSVNDPYAGSAWHLSKMQAPLAWDVSRGAGVTVAVLDTGVDGAHPDLAGQLVPGWNVVTNSADTSDAHGHGTKVAGVVAAATNNGLGVGALAWESRLMPVRVSGADGYAYNSAIASALTWAADHGAKVANVSYAVTDSSAVRSAAQYFRNQGGVVVVAAGNEGVLDPTAATDALLTVGATDGADLRASWSNYGAHLDVAAPGVGVWTTTRGGGYGAVSGTSFSSPATAGVLALMMAANPGLAPPTLEGLLRTTAVDLGAAGPDAYYGHGRVNAAAAVLAARDAAPADTAAPTARLSSPTGGERVQGVVGVDVSAADDVGVTVVALFANGVRVAEDGAAPYQFSWDSTTVPDGTVRLWARAHDAAGNYADSTAVSVTVANAPEPTEPPAPADTLAPTVTFASPADGSVAGNAVSVQVRAGDDVAVARLSLYVGGTLKATAVGGSLNFKWNTRKVASGTHTLTAVAEDAAGNRASSAVRVIVR